MLNQFTVERIALYLKHVQCGTPHIFQRMNTKLLTNFKAKVN